jgi:hypothetical protein
MGAPPGRSRPLRDEPRSTGCTVAESDSSVGAPAPARGKDRAGAFLRMTAVLPGGVFWVFVDFVAGGGRSCVGRGGHRSLTPARCPVEAKRRVGRGVGCGRGPSAFFAGGTRAAAAPQEPAVTDPPPRDLVDSRAARKVEAPSPVQRTHRRLLRANGQAGSCTRRAAGGGVGRVQRVHGGKGVCGRFRDTHRCGSLRRHGGGPFRATDPRRCLQRNLR